MVRLREIPRTASFAWSLGSASPLIATGTRAGAVDADFSNETQLELWDLDLDNTKQGLELQPVGSIGVDSRFHDLAWSEPNDVQARGIIAGALESGSVDLWDAEKLKKGASDVHLSRISKHSGAAKALQFNPTKHELLATSGAKGELYITDLNNVASPFRLGTSAARADDFDALDWNKKVAHILVTGSSGGFVTVWDVRAKKESLTLNNQGRKAVSAVAWDPTVPTRLATAIPNDQDPLILMWDLRNSNAPEKILKGHDQGVLSLSWCQQDGDLLLSCGKDNRTICWDPHAGVALGEYPVVTNWEFQTRWNPHNPSLLATASFDGKIAVQTIQNTNVAAGQAAAVVQPVDGEDFFSKAQGQPQGEAFSLPKAPKWLERPVGVSFGFGGKVVRFGPAEEGSRKSSVSITTFAVDSAVGESSEKFEQALQQGDLSAFCESKIAAAKTEEEKADWKVIETLMSSEPRKNLMDYIGFANDTTTVNGEVPETPGAKANGANNASSFFDENAEAGDNFLLDLASSKGAKTNSPFKIYTGTESDADKKITKALMLGSFETALDTCLQEDRMSDAFMIAICGGQKCIDKAQAAYFKRKTGGPNYLRLLASVVGKNLWDFIYNADLQNWKEVMATICTFADQAEFPDLCEALGDRLEELVTQSSDKGSYRKDATFCYLAGSKLEKVVGNWVQELEENETDGIEAEDGESRFSIHTRSLQDFIEKVTVFRQATKFQDKELNLSSDWKLAPLYAKYTEYADVAAAHGQLQIAEKYLDLLPEQYPAAQVARNRVKQATKKPASHSAQKQAGNTAAQRSQRVVPSYNSITPATVPTVAANAYAPLGAAVPAQSNIANPYTPAGAATSASVPSAPYAPAGYQPMSQQAYSSSSLPQPQPFGSNFQSLGQAVPPPPRGFSSSPSVPPPSKVANLAAWNDTPDFGSKPVSRRGTPAAGQAAITSPFPNAQPSPTIPGPPTTALPRAPPRTMSPAITPGVGADNRPTPSTPYAPMQGAQPVPGPPTQFAPPRISSPYNPPPSTGPPSNRYAPAPGTQPSAAVSTMSPQRQVAPPPSQFAPPNTFGASTPLGNTMVPNEGSKPAPGPPPRSGPPMGPPKNTPYNTASAPLSTPTPEPENRSVPPSADKPVAKYPPGDRSHMSPADKPIFDVFNTEMQRVKAAAPVAYKAQVLDTEKRLNILFDQLNDGEMLRPETISSLRNIAGSISSKDFETGKMTVTNLIQSGNEANGTVWLVGVKRLLAMGGATAS